MLRYTIKRVLWMIPVLLGVLLLVFTINHFTPGDPVASLLGSNYTQEQYDMKKAELGLDKSFVVQYVVYIKNIVTKFDLGTSYGSGLPVKKELASRFPLTLALGLIGVTITVILGIPTGLRKLYRKHWQK